MELERKKVCVTAHKGFQNHERKAQLSGLQRGRKKKRHRKKTGRHWQEIRRKAEALSPKPKRNMSRSSKASHVQQS